VVKKKEEKVGNDVQQPPRQTGNSVQKKFEDAVHAAKMVNRDNFNNNNPATAYI